MMSSGNHIINSEVFEFTCHEAVHAFQLQHELTHALQNNIQNIMSDVLDIWNGGGETITIDKLELDLGEISFRQLAELITSKLGANLIDRLQEINLPSSSADTPASSRESRSDIELLEYVLSSGSLPWWAGPTGEFSLDELINRIIKNHPSEARALLLQNSINHQFLERIVLQVSATLARRLLSFIPEFSQILEKVENRLRELTAFYLPQNDNEDWQRNILLLSIKLMRTDHYDDDTIWTSLLYMTGEMRTGWQGLDSTNLDRSILPVKLKEFCESILMLKQSREHNPEYEPQITQLLLKNNGEKIYIQNAGLVLVAPFLPSFFQELNLIKEGNFIDASAQNKAMFLLHYLCTGDSAAPEYTLQLNKILTGIPLTNPISAFASITEAEKGEAQTLLKDVIKHWSALKSSSVEGLQGTFLLRDGLLSFSHDHYVLQIERLGCDILLDSVPWSWQTTRLNWMEHYLQAEW